MDDRTIPQTKKAVVEEHLGIINPQVLYSWKAPLRAYKRKPAGVLRFYIALSLLLSLIVFFFGEKILVLPIWATVFLVYVLTITPPPIIENKITKFGLESAENTYRWELLSHFYIIRKFDYYVVVIVGAPAYINHVYLVVKDNSTLKTLVKLLSEHLIYQEKPHKTFTDKLAEWLTKLMPDQESFTQEEKRADPSATVAATP